MLTGGIASGKTIVSDTFAELGVPVVDTDRIARELVEQDPEVLASITGEFGPEVLERPGVLNRRMLREMIFADPTARRRLERIVHPRIEAEARRRLREASGCYAVLVVPLLVESGLFRDADRVLVVDVPETVQLARLQQRDGVDEGQARHALQAQASRRQRLAMADDVLENTSGPDELRAQVRALDRCYRAMWEDG